MPYPCAGLDNQCAEPMENRRQEKVRTERLERVKRGIAERIGHVCDNLSRTEFDALVTRIAEIEIKYSLRDRMDLRPMPEPPSSEGGSDGP